MGLYFDRKGNPIGLFEWAALSENPDYRKIRQDTIMGNQWLSTIWIGIAGFENIMGGPPHIFETMRFLIRDGMARKLMRFPHPDSGELTTQVRYVTEEDAYRGHMKILDLIREREMS